MRTVFSGLALHLTEPFDFGFLLRYGTPFSVYEGLDSGYIGFGLKSEKWGFLYARFAGAPLEGAVCTPDESRERAERAAPVYYTLAHPALNCLLGHGRDGGGVLSLFRWIRAESLLSADTFTAEGDYHPYSALARFQRKPLFLKLELLDDLFAFHAFAEEKGYMACALSEDHILWNHDTDSLIVGNADAYHPFPAENRMVRRPGSPRFLAPEEYVPGARLDGATTEYALGALAFAILGAGGRRDRKSFAAPELLYRVAARAVQERPEKRYGGAVAFLRAWRDAMQYV